MLNTGMKFAEGFVFYWFSHLFELVDINDYFFFLSSPAIMDKVKAVIFIVNDY